MRMTEDELAAAADEFLPAEPFDDDESDSDNDYEDDLSYESEF